MYEEDPSNKIQSGANIIHITASKETNIIYFCSVRLNFSISYKESASKSLQSTEISLYLAFTNELNVAQKEKKY